MIKRFKLYNESVRDKMTPVSKEDILRKLSDNFVKTVMDVNEFDNIDDANKWIMEHINEITKLSDMYSSDKIVNMLFDMTDMVKRKFNLQNGGIVDNGRCQYESVIVNRDNIKEIFDFIKDSSSWFIGVYYSELINTWDMIDNMYDIKNVKLSIPSFSKDKTFDGRFKAYISFVFDIGIKNNPMLVFNANHTKTPYIWIRTSNTSWTMIPLDESDLKNKIETYLK
jgi:hypothetical protein